MVRDHFWVTEEDPTNEGAWALEEGTGFWLREEAVDIAMNNYLRISGAGRMSVAGFGVLVLAVAAGVWGWCRG